MGGQEGGAALYEIRGRSCDHRDKGDARSAVYTFADALRRGGRGVRRNLSRNCYPEKRRTAVLRGSCSATGTGCHLRRETACGQPRHGEASACRRGPPPVPAGRRPDPREGSAFRQRQFRVAYEAAADQRAHVLEGCAAEQTYDAFRRHGRRDRRRSRRCGLLVQAWHEQRVAPRVPPRRH